MPAPNNVLELKRLLAEKFPGVRMSAGQTGVTRGHWPTGIAPLDDFLKGGLPKGGIIEMVSAGAACGSALLIAGLVEQASQTGRWLALIDAADSFDPSALNNRVLRRLLWMRCRNPREALKAADLILHDGTAAVAVLDLALCPLAQVRRIPSSTWFRLKRLADNIATALLVITPEPQISNATARFRLERRFALEALDLSHEILRAQLSMKSLEAQERIARTA